MATYTEYPPHTMASNNLDFPLYPDMWSSDPNFPALSTYPDQSYLSTTTYDSFQTQPAFETSHYDFAPNSAVARAKASFQEQHSNFSPATSSFDYQNPPILSSTSDSGQSTTSSAMGSPSQQPIATEWRQQPNFHLVPGIVQQPDSLFGTSSFDLDPLPVAEKGCVDPALIQPFSPNQYAAASMPDLHVSQPSPHNNFYTAVPSPGLSKSVIRSPRMAHSKAARSTSPFVGQQHWQPYPQYSESRRHSISSVHSRHSQTSLSSDESNKGLCPLATCGRHVKDLKAHMLTHQNERPEKCPIPTCDYHVKGFARKYDKNRHTLTHYKGTMVCGFCPGSGSAAEKSFNRADVFKRHLTSVHGVEQTPPNARRKTPTATATSSASAGSSSRAFGATPRDSSGMCSTCGNTFASAQDFYEHLDDCVLRVVQQADPSEAINEKLLSSVADDEQVQETMEKNHLPTTFDFSHAPMAFDEEDDDADDDDDMAAEDEDDAHDGAHGARPGRSGKGKFRKGTGS